MDMSFIASCLAFYTGESMKSLKMQPEVTVPRQTPSSGVITHFYYTPMSTASGRGAKGLQH